MSFDLYVYESYIFINCNIFYGLRSRSYFMPSGWVNTHYWEEWCRLRCSYGGKLWFKFCQTFQLGYCVSRYEIL